MPKPFYIKINAVYQKLKQAELDETTIYVHAPVGVGKTAAVRYFYRNHEKECVWLTGKEDHLQKLPTLQELADSHKKVLIIDDISWIEAEESRKYILAMVKQPEIHLVLMGRSRIPGWLMSAYTSGNLSQADERDLLFHEEHIVRFLKEFGLEEPEDVIAQIYQDTKGYPLSMHLIAEHLSRDREYGPAVMEEIRLELYRYFDYAFFDQWITEERQLLLAVSDFDSFDTELAKMITLNQRVPALLEYAVSVGDFLQRDQDGRYRLRPLLRGYLIWKKNLVWDEKKKKEVHELASSYYELNNDIPAALLECKRSGNENRIVDLLEKNARQHPGTGHYYETKGYYADLSEERILHSPVLIAGMSMLSSLLLQPDRSEYWYDRLVEYENDKWNDNQKRKDAKNRIAYLDIALPHRGILSIVEILKKAALLCTSKSITLPEFSVTSNLPSIMNGGKDFSEWSRNDKELAKLLRKPVEIVLGPYGAGLVNIALAESAFEKADQDDYEIITLLDEGYKKAEIKGKIEICFAAMGILCKLHTQRNHLKLAEEQLSAFEEKARKEQLPQMLPNIHALQTWFALQRGDHGALKTWIRQTPDEFTKFYILDRYQYMIKLRCYIALEQYDSAWMLSECLHFYFTRYGRHYMEMENILLRAILCYKQGKKQWKESFETAYREAESYHFVWLIAQEGMAVLPLLKEWAATQPELQTDSFYQAVWGKTETQAFQYPNYLCQELLLKEPLTDMEQKILQLNSSGKSSAQIQELCRITERTLRFHNGNIYKKLGVKTKSEAILAAKQLGLVN